jgi:hypothetical protein
VFASSLWQPGVAIGGTSGGEIATEQLAQLGARIVLIARGRVNANWPVIVDVSSP